MNSLKPAVLTAAFLFGSLLCANAWAAGAPTGNPTDAPTSAPINAPTGAEVDAYAKLPTCQLSADGRRLVAEPCRTAPAARPMPRRPVPLTIQRMPNNKVAPQVAMPQMAPSTPIETLMQPPGAPIPAVGCNAGGCYDPSGVRHNSGAAGTTVTPAGKLCQRQGVWLQC